MARKRSHEIKVRLNDDELKNFVARIKKYQLSRQYFLRTCAMGIPVVPQNTCNNYMRSYTIKESILTKSQKLSTQNRTALTSIFIRLRRLKKYGNN